VEDDAPFKIVVKARQTGYSFAATLRAVLKCLERRLTWIFLSKGERQSRLLMEKVREHVQACGIVAETSESAFFEGTLTKQLETRFPNGSVIYGLPANPDTARGYTGNVTLDEFAFHQDAAKVYSALYPTVTRGFSLEIISTPNGQQGKFFELAKQAGLVAAAGLTSSEFKVQSSKFKTPNSEFRTHNSELANRWSGHRLTIYDAVAQGFEVDIDALRAGVGDEETWLQEYCCEFLSDAQNYIPMEMIMSCVSEQASTEWPAGSADLQVRGSSERAADLKVCATGDLYLGVDIGRKRDLTVAWLFEKIGDVMWSRALLTMKGQTFEVQERAICDLIEGQLRVESQESKVNRDLSTLNSRLWTSAVRRCCIDQSGLGMMLAERLQKKYGARVEPVQFTAQVKEKLAPMVKRHFEDRLVRIPDNREVRADLNAVKRYVTPAGNVRFDAEHTDKGHADRFWALALALEAASQPVGRLADAGAVVGRPIAAGLGGRVL
jgi:phage FluMu gp28-like protein